MTPDSALTSDPTDAPFKTLDELELAQWVFIDAARSEAGPNDR